MDEDLISEIEDRLTYGDSFSAWVSNAAEQRLSEEEN